MSLVCSAPRDFQPDILFTPLYRWVDDPNTMTLSGTVVNSWKDTVKGNVMLNSEGSPTLDDGVRINGANFFQTDSPVSGFRSYAAVCFFRDGAYRGMYFPILTDASHYAYAGGYKNGELFNISYSHPYLKNARIYSSAGYKGIGSSVNNLYLWDRWEILLVCSPAILPSFNRFGRDRNYMVHEFSGSLREILFFSEDLYANATLRGQVLSYLSKRLT